MLIGKFLGTWRTTCQFLLLFVSMLNQVVDFNSLISKAKRKD